MLIFDVSSFSKNSKGCVEKQNCEDLVVSMARSVYGSLRHLSGIIQQSKIDGKRRLCETVTRSFMSYINVTMVVYKRLRYFRFPLNTNSTNNS